MHNRNGMVKDFSKMYISSFFLTYNWILQNTIFANLQNKLQILNKSIKTLQWYIICHILTSNMGLRGGRGSNWPLPPRKHILVFKYPSKDRVNLIIIFYFPAKLKTCLYFGIELIAWAYCQNQYNNYCFTILWTRSSITN